MCLQDVEAVPGAGSAAFNLYYKKLYTEKVTRDAKAQMEKDARVNNAHKEAISEINKSQIEKDARVEKEQKKKDAGVEKAQMEKDAEGNKAHKLEVGLSELTGC